MIIVILILELYNDVNIIHSVDNTGTKAKGNLKLDKKMNLKIGLSEANITITGCTVRNFNGTW